MKNSKTFNKNKAELINSLDLIINQYDEFTKSVSPKSWRMIGFHFSSLKNIKEDIMFVNEISKQEKENDWVKEQLR